MEVNDDMVKKAPIESQLRKRHKPGPAPLYGKADILIWAKIPRTVATWLDREARKIKTPLTAAGRTRMSRAQIIRQILIKATLGAD